MSSREEKLQLHAMLWSFVLLGEVIHIILSDMYACMIESVQTSDLDSPVSFQTLILQHSQFLNQSQCAQISHHHYCWIKKCGTEVRVVIRAMIDVPNVCAQVQAFPDTFWQYPATNAQLHQSLEGHCTQSIEFGRATR